MATLEYITERHPTVRITFNDMTEAQLEEFGKCFANRYRIVLWNPDGSIRAGMDTSAIVWFQVIHFPVANTP